MKNKLALSNIALAILLSMSTANAAEPVQIGEDVRACTDGVAIGTNVKSDIICANNGGVGIGSNIKSNGGVVIGGNSNQSYGSNGNIVGNQSTGAGDYVNIFGNENNATMANIFGNRNKEVRGNIVGNDNRTVMVNSLMDDPNIHGNRNIITAENGGAATSVSSAAFGNDNSIKGSNNAILGNGNLLDASGVVITDSVFVGSNIYANSASGKITDAAAFGKNAGVQGSRTLALGAGASALADDCTALGAGAMCVESKTTAFGDTRLTNIANGIRDTDAAAMGQLTGVARIIGGGTRFENGNLVTPTWYFRDNSTHTTISSALDNLDERIERAGNGGAGQDGYSAYELAQQYGYEGTEREWLASLKGDKGDKGDPGVAGAAGENGQPGKDGQDGMSGGAGSKVTAGNNVEVTESEDGTQSVALTDNVELSEQGSVKVGATTVSNGGVTVKDGPSLTTNGIDAGNQRVSNVAAGRIEQGSQDAVNGGQIYDLRNELNDKWEATNRRFDGIEKRLNGLGAQTAAMSMMAASGAGLPVGKVAIQAGVGFNGGASAMAVGYRVRTSEKVSFSAGLSFGGNGTKPMGGVGMSIILD
ncbi:YadA-like family protein [Stenotrophomonas maltophilia]|uniref:YadA-like family protein n=1 Tax=Stenotrophomonas maltophilia TaxID=40324 RepID=UPI0012B03850|nr:YadA-like family protein [Stenotrophomonas maltophilia]QGL66967.1 hypothetical protein FEO86_06585 [Stenotrophomonas maltophilia]